MSPSRGYIFANNYPIHTYHNQLYIQKLYILFHRAAYFHGQIEQPVRGIMALVNQKDMEVLIAVNERGVFIIDPYECVCINN